MSDLALRWYPFGTDEPHDGDRALSDKMVICREAHDCQLCGGKTTPGTLTRVRTDIYAGEIATYRWCADCCEAMRLACGQDEPDEPIQRRYELRERNEQPENQPKGHDG